MIIGENLAHETLVCCPACIKREGPAPPSNPPILETTILILATRHAARLAAGVLLSCILVPAHAKQPASQRPASRCEASGKPCPPAKRTRAATQECRRLRTAITESEQAERHIRSAMMEAVQQDLFNLRKRYKTLGC
ncbi:hypothetical protein [Massilia yuzhufengensis]|uniref:Uncharacterized protein n=1 Tax=Massilia yuzhufengensis TaxID=1164594 RepID=A0A1I1WBS7_9BURK|nr:hypothetical protein [Massilia yuzhufengensis]SFD92449.1 hypothetical protein SAMN05216204_1469 [Massilia yuzhufengensis]